MSEKALDLIDQISTIINANPNGVAVDAMKRVEERDQDTDWLRRELYLSDLLKAGNADRLARANKLLNELKDELSS